MIRHLLCIDDEQITQMLNQVIFKRTGFCEQVTTALNGQLALDFFDQVALQAPENSNAPELILLDLNMPVLDGWGFLEKFTRQYIDRFPEITIFILSSSVDPKDLEKAGQHPLVKGFVSKPMTIEAINELKKHPSLERFFQD